MFYLHHVLSRAARNALLGLLLGPMVALPVLAAASDLADAPLFTTSASEVKPNIMFILDDSGSMAWDYLPNAASAFASNEYGYRASQCNGLAFNPDTVYTAPLDYTGASLPDAPLDFFDYSLSDLSDLRLNQYEMGGQPAVGTDVELRIDNNSNSSYSVGEKVTVYSYYQNARYFVATVLSWSRNGNGNNNYGRLKVRVTGLSSMSGTMGWSVVGRGEPVLVPEVYYTYKGTQPRLGFAYNSDGERLDNTFYTQCNYDVGTTSGKAVFTEVKVTPSSANVQNYANWRKFYRTRIDMMKTAASHAFKRIDQRYRLGFSTINAKTASEADEGLEFLHIRDIGADLGQKQKFYQSLNSIVPEDGTPLRAALSKAGRYYAGKAPKQGSNDPVQYACQRNYTILSSDGYWNDPDKGSGSFGPFNLSGTLVNDQDGGLRRPMRDAKKAKNTLADVAAYYYETDLRTSALNNCMVNDVNVCDNKVPGTASEDAYRSFGDSATHQHMTTFTVGLGVNGTMKFRDDYLTANVNSSDFYKIVNNSLDWPEPEGDRATTTDDLWHAAVNGRGQYFSAGDPSSLAQSLTQTLDEIKATLGSASAASTSSLQPVETDKDIFVAQFTTMKWIGDVLAYTIDPALGTISTTKTWSAQEKLQAMATSDRKIYYASPTKKALRPFVHDELKADSYLGWFTDFCSKADATRNNALPEQCATFNSTETTEANKPTNLIPYLRGDNSTYYRARDKRLGDIINASPLFVGKPNFKYADSSYQTFASTKAGRTAVVLAAANDGMLHAFDRTDGKELWAFIPTAVMPKLHRLADTAYPISHTYTVDGSPQMGDIKVGSEWKTIVVGGLNKGGRGYYALDVTDPSSPQILWEFTDTDLGYTFGNPIITMRQDGSWVVVFASGYDNVSPGDGNGYLYVLDAYKGAKDGFLKIPTLDAGGKAIGTEASPSGLARINAWVDSDLENKALRFYGGDMAGNVWRFDTEDLVAPKGKALRLAELKSTDGSAQPVTVNPILAEIDYNGTKHPVVYLATGIYLRKADLDDKTVQSIYAIKDPLTDSPYGNVRSNSNFVTQSFTITSGTKDRTSTAKTVDWSAKAGWRVDLPVGGERVSVNPQIALDTLYVGSNLPTDDANCTVGGDSFLYQFDIATGQATGAYVGNVLIQGLTLVQLTAGAGTGSVVTIITKSDGGLSTKKGAPPPSTGVLRRTSWRELVD